MFVICKKCKSGSRTDIGEENLRILGWGDGRHSCGGETEVVTDREAGAGPRMDDETEESN